MLGSKATGCLLSLLQVNSLPLSSLFWLYVCWGVCLCRQATGDHDAASHNQVVFALAKNKFPHASLSLYWIIALVVNHNTSANNAHDNRKRRSSSNNWTKITAISSQKKVPLKPVHAYSFQKCYPREWADSACLHECIASCVDCTAHCSAVATSH